LRAFQRYLARHLHIRKSGRFSSFSGNLIPGPSFGHNLRFRYPNGSCEPILDIYVSIAFQRYKEFVNTLSFLPLQSLSEHSEVHRDSNSQGRSSLGSVRVHSLALSFTPELPLLARNLVSLCLGCEPKAKVAIWLIWWWYKHVRVKCWPSKKYNKWIKRWLSQWISSRWTSLQVNLHDVLHLMVMIRSSKYISW